MAVDQDVAEAPHGTDAVTKKEERDAGMRDFLRRSQLRGPHSSSELAELLRRHGIRELAHKYDLDKKVHEETRAVRLDAPDYMDISETYTNYGSIDDRKVSMFAMFTIGDSSEELWALVKDAGFDTGSDNPAQVQPQLRAYQLMLQKDGKYRFNPASEIPLRNGEETSIMHTEDVLYNGKRTGRSQVSKVTFNMKNRDNMLHIVPDGNATLVVRSNPTPRVAPQIE